MSINKSYRNAPFESKNVLIRDFGFFCKTFKHCFTYTITHCIMVCFQVLRLIVLAFSDNSSAESGLQRLQLLECMHPNWSNLCQTFFSFFQTPDVFQLVHRWFWWFVEQMYCMKWENESKQSYIFQSNQVGVIFEWYQVLKLYHEILKQRLQLL